ncbi:XRE family transcriptional regulator [Sinorhizobium meliloti]|uniref:XRE family transcriptional regulator n=1 Tax=Rhizobium meliloti TaxID=382 RepID=UPI000FD9610A|nr:helix-turn-helix domain-containing protein [Sinorhizobium meliloti]RVN04069.1 hypothetical protein CN112_26045 [Sinorhizobium meliloti]
MTKLGDTIRDKREALGVNQTVFGEMWGVDQRTVSDLEGGRKAYPRNWQRLADVCGIPPIYDFVDLMDNAAREIGRTQRRPRDLPPPRHKRPRQDDANERQIHDVPLLGYAVGGESADEYLFNGEIVDYTWRPAPLIGVPGAYAITIAGSSMEPRFPPGTTAWVDPEKMPKREMDVVIQLRPAHEGLPPRGFVKRFVGWTPGHLIVRQFNPEAVIRYPRADVDTVHPIVFPQ